MSDRVQIQVVNKILGMRSKYQKLRNPDNQENFWSLCDLALEELKDFAKLTGYVIDVGIISCSDEDFEIHQNTGTIGEYIFHDKNHL